MHLSENDLFLIFHNKYIYIYNYFFHNLMARGTK